MVRWTAFLIGLPSGVRKKGVLLLGVFLAGVVVPVWLGEWRKGDRDREGEWNCEGGAEIGGFGAFVAGLGVIGAELTSFTSPIFFFFLNSKVFPLAYV